MKNSNKKIDRILIISFVIISIISMCLVPNANQKNSITDFDGSDNVQFLNISDTYLNFSSITQNRISVYRVFDYVKFEVNTSGFSGANSTIMRVDFNDIDPRK